MSLIFVMACSPDNAVVPAGSNDTGTDTTSTTRDTTEPVTTTTPTGSTTDPTTTDPTTETPTETTPPEPVETVRFIAMGDGGEGNDTQYQVADVLNDVCAAKTDDAPGCDFVLYLGDNFYDGGVDSIDDSLFQDAFELPYQDVDLPFWVVLGNHDYGEKSILAYRTEYQVEYSDVSEKWNMPDQYYTFAEEHVAFFGLDTTAIMNEVVFGESEQRDWLPDELAKATERWKIGFGHHPYVSNGQHGNAGAYEGLEWLPVVNGESVKNFFDDNMCGQVDIYFSGHDHNRQWLEPACGTQFVVSGAAAKTTDLVGRDSATMFEDDQLGGFMWVEIAGDTLTGEFWNENGEMDFSHSFVKSE